MKDRTQNKRILVTGATGFVGVHLCRYLHQIGDHVIGTSLTAVKRSKYDWPIVKINLKDEPFVNELIRQHKPTAICHLAAQSIPRLSWHLEDETTESNVIATLRVLDAIRRFSPKTKLLFISTNQVHGKIFRSKTRVHEADIYWPENPYASSKAIAELACLNYAMRFNLFVMIARPFNHLGSGQSAKLVFSDWCRQIARAEKGLAARVLRVGNLDVYRDFLHVEDVVHAYRLLLQRGKRSEIYTISAGKKRLLQDYVDYLLKQARVPLKTQVEKKRLRKNDPPHICGSSRKLHALGWKPQKSAFSALSDLLEEWRSKV